MHISTPKHTYSKNKSKNANAHKDVSTTEAPIKVTPKTKPSSNNSVTIKDVKEKPRNASSKIQITTNENQKRPVESKQQDQARRKKIQKEKPLTRKEKKFQKQKEKYFAKKDKIHAKYLARYKKHHPNDPESKAIEYADSKTNKKLSNSRSAGSMILLLIGTILLGFPIVSDLYANYLASQSIETYSQSVESMTQEDRDHLFAEAIAHNHRLANIHDDNDVNIEDKDYHDILDVTGTGIMGYIEISCIGVRQPIYHGTEDNVLMAGVGHMDNSSFPVESGTSHAAIAGHTGMPGQRMFDELVALEPGDMVKISILDRTYYYDVVSSRVVEPNEKNFAELEDGKDLLTLITCTPYGINDHRLLVECELAQYQEANDTISGIAQLDKISKYLNLRTLPVIIVVVIIILSIIVNAGKKLRKRKKKKQQEKDKQNRQDSAQSKENDQHARGEQISSDVKTKTKTRSIDSPRHENS